jgi:hypothetical protein
MSPATARGSGPETWRGAVPRIGLTDSDAASATEPSAGALAARCRPLQSNVKSRMWFGPSRTSVAMPECSCSVSPEAL